MQSEWSDHDKIIGTGAILFILIAGSTAHIDGVGLVGLLVGFVIMMVATFLAERG